MSLRNAVDEGHGRIVYGVDLSHGAVRGDDGTGDIATNAMSQSAAYVQQTWESGNGNRVYAGLRGERDASLGGQYSPSFGFTERIARNLSLKGNVARAFRAPSASELYFPFYGNPALRPERSRVGDLSLNDSAIAGGASLGWFFNFSQDLIVPDLTTFMAVNKNQAAISGLTLSLRTLPMNRITAAVNVTDLYRAQGFDASGAMSRLPNDPVINANVDLTYSGRQNDAVTEAGLRMRVVGNRGPVTFNAPLFDQPVSYSRLDAYVRTRLGERAVLTLRGYNLGNERYAEIGGYPMPGRAFGVELSTH
ncbi:MAG: TonB-dependent receptor [Candidatus Eremiobacteraeota bacterium]|nr:TonB-dependent receptor [Candidatus Eremiobacteraeota bacterium]